MSKKDKPEQSASVYDVIKLLDVASHAGYVQKKFKLAGATTDVEARRSSAVSTGLLMTDVMLNGGIYPGGWYTFFGPEQSGKSTHMLGVMASLFYSNVPYVGYFDSEGSSSTDYIEAIAQASNVNRDIDIKKVFGIRNPNRKNKKDPEWVIEPRIWYYPENSLESFYKSVSAILRRLPDKVNLDGEWWLLFERNKENISRFKGQHDTKIGDQYGKIAVRAPDGGAMQALIIIDSYPALVTDSDDDDDGDNSLGVNARGHSKHINKVKGKLKRKHATVLGVNQLRDAINIGNPYGPKEYEPGGNSLKYSCFHKDTFLFSENGMFTAEEYYHKYHKKPIPVLSKIGMETPQAFFPVGYSPIYRLETEYGYYLEGKPGHKVMVLNGVEGKPEWVKFEDIKLSKRSDRYVPIKVGGYVFPEKPCEFDFQQPRPYGDTNDTDLVPTLPTEMTAELARIAGWLVGDGHVKNGIINFASRDEEQIDNFVETMSICFKVDESILNNYRTERGWHCGYNKTLCQFFTYIGFGHKSSWTKEVPWSIRQSTAEHQAEFISGLMDADGSVGGGSQISYSTVSNRLMHQVQQILLNFGIISKVAWYENYHSHGLELTSIKDRDSVSTFGPEGDKCSQMTIYGRHAYRYMEEIGFNLSRKQDTDLRFNSKSKDFSQLLPDLGYWKAKVDPQILDLFRDYNRVENLCLYHINSKSFNWVSDWVEENTTRTRRIKLREGLKLVKNLVKKSKEYEMTWIPITKIGMTTENSLCYDLNMPETSTVITNGILSHNSDCRISQRPRSVPHGSGQLEEEQTVLHRNGVDTYRYICMKAIKNKFGSAFLEAWYRIWISDPRGQGHGFCPVYDTYRYLLATGQLSGSMGKKLNIYIDDDQYEGLTWLDFKCLILLQGEELKEFCKELNIKKKPLIRERCFEQIRSGRGIDMFYKVLHGNEDEELEELDVPYEEWKKVDLIAEVVDRKLLKKKDARKLKELELIKELYSDDGESYEPEDED